MSEPQPTATAWPALGMNERRVLGVLVEKAKTTPDAYPMTMNGLVTGSNQKSNRDPLMDLTEDDVAEALAGVQKKGLAIRITGSRVERWRHALYEAWGAGKTELAILAELLLRGPQTEGELRGRASRMEPIDDLETLRGLLKPLVERGLVAYLGPEGRRGTMLTHGFHEPQELKHLRIRHGDEAGNAPATRVTSAGTAMHQSPTAERPTMPDPRLAEVKQEIADLRQVVHDLQAQVAHLSDQLAALKNALGA